MGGRKKDGFTIPPEHETLGGAWGHPSGFVIPKTLLRVKCWPLVYFTSELFDW